MNNDSRRCQLPRCRQFFLNSGAHAILVLPFLSKIVLAFVHTQGVTVFGHHACRTLSYLDAFVLRIKLPFLQERNGAGAGVP